MTAPADVVEEVARLVGYERIPDTLPTGQVMDLAPGEIDERDDEARDVMAGLGFAECVTYALTSEARMARLLPPDLLDASPDDAAERHGHVGGGAGVVDERCRTLPDRQVAAAGPRAAAAAQPALNGRERPAADRAWAPCWKPCAPTGGTPTATCCSSTSSPRSWRATATCRRNRTS